MLVTAELPMFALILQRAAIPMPMGSSLPARCTRFAGMTNRPCATSSRILSTGSDSRRATYSISGVVWPERACSICVIENPLRKRHQDARVHLVIVIMVIVLDYACRSIWSARGLRHDGQTVRIERGPPLSEPSAPTTRMAGRPRTIDSSRRASSEDRNGRPGSMLDAISRTIRHRDQRREWER